VDGDDSAGVIRNDRNSLQGTGLMKINLRTAGVGAIGLAMLAALAGCNGNDIAIASKDVGAQWPFTVPEVRVVCGPALAIFIAADGKAYPLNGQAERHPDLYTESPYKESPLGKLNDIWKADPEMSKLTPDARMPLDAFTEKAIEACAKTGKWDPSRVAGTGRPALALAR
jgi:hypothetical protein